jgi:hypothetical protein
MLLCFEKSLVESYELLRLIGSPVENFVFVIRQMSPDHRRDELSN